MTRVHALVSVSILIALATATALLRAEGDPAPQGGAESPAPAFTPVQSVHDMMEGQKKLYEEIKDGVLDKQWEDAARSAWILAEIANVNQYQNAAGEYKGLARQMSEDCAKLAQALKKREADAAKQLVQQVGQTCSACHNKFRK